MSHFSSLPPLTVLRVHGYLILFSVKPQSCVFFPLIIHRFLVAFCIFSLSSIKALRVHDKLILFTFPLTLFSCLFLSQSFSLSSLPRVSSIPPLRVLCVHDYFILFSILQKICFPSRVDYIGSLSSLPRFSSFSPVKVLRVHDCFIIFTFTRLCFPVRVSGGPFISTSFLFTSTT